MGEHHNASIHNGILFNAERRIIEIVGYMESILPTLDHSLSPVAWHLPSTTHCHLLPGICINHDIEHQLLQRQLNFIRSCIESNNSIVRLAIKKSMYGSLSPVSNSIALLRDRFNISNQFFTSNRGSLPSSASVPDIAISIREFSIAHHKASFIDKQNIYTLLYYVM